MNIPEEALKRFPPSMPVDNMDGTDYYVDDEWGYDQCQRQAFIAGAEWACREALREAARLVDAEGHLWGGAASHDFFHTADKIRALAEGEQG